MMIVISRAANTVSLDGVAHTVNLSAIGADIDSVIFNTETGTGTIYSGTASRPIGRALFDAAFGKYRSAWNALHKQPPPPSQAEIDAAAQDQADHQQYLADRAAAKIDPTLIYLVTHTPAQCEAYVLANVNTLAQAKTMLGKMAMALSVLARREFKQ